MENESLEKDNPLDADPNETGAGGEDAPKKDDGDKTPSKPEDKDKKPEPFLMNFPNKETAEKSFKEEQAKITKLAMENAAIKAKVEVLEKMQQPDYENKTSERQKKRDEELLARLEEGGSRATLEVIREGLMDVVDLTKKDREAMKSEILQMLDERDPELSKNKEEIEAIKTEYGVSTDKARKLFKRLQEAKVPESTETRAKIPGRTTVTSSGEEASTSAKMPSYVESYLSDSGLDEEAQKRVRASIAQDIAKKEG